MNIFNDLTGRTFGRLTVLARAENNAHNDTAWSCLCSCGNTKIIVRTSLIRGKTKSCGCLKKDLLKLPKGEAAHNSLYAKYKFEARKRKIYFSITKEEFRKLVITNCFHCGIEPNHSAIKRAGLGCKNVNGDFLYNGLDRLDNTIGYVASNCVPCCAMCNFAKGTTKVVEFDAWIKRAYEHKFS